MEQYLRRSKLSGAIDAAGRRALLLILSMLWFIALWGVRIQALTAGAALFCLLLILLRKTRAGRLKRREERLRARVGGELAVERLVLAKPDRAHFEIALRLSERHDLTLVRAGARGVKCLLRGEKLLVALKQQHASASLSADDVLAFQRAVLAENAARGVLCAPCAVDAAAREQALAPPRVTLLEKPFLVELLGAAAPATDEQLRQLGERRRARAGAKKWLRHILDRRRAPRFFLYGALLIALYLITGQRFYPLPGCLCMALFAACRCAPARRDIL